MRLFVIGANGRTGREILDLARSRGHHATAFVRSPDTLRPSDSLTVVPGDPRRRDSIAAALAGHDAVLSAIGPHAGDALRPSTLMADCARATVEAMIARGVMRLAIVSAAPLFPTKDAWLAVVGWMLRHHARDLRAMEQIVRESGLDWTIARPPRLIRSAEAGFVAMRDALPPGRRSMAFRSVAAFLIDAVEHRVHVGDVVGLGRRAAEVAA